jgi:rieske iron-sulfur protein
MSEMRISRGPMRQRRAVVGAGLGLAPWLVAKANARDADAIPPQPGDRFVHLTGPKKGQVVRCDDLALGSPQVQVYPVDPASGVVRNGSRLNLVVLARFDPDELSADTRARAFDGVVAYSAVCTHQGCPVNMWSKDQVAFVCSCHGSLFNPKDGAKVVGGPAPRALPSLGLKVEDGAPVVAAGFSARVGAMQV